MTTALIIVAVTLGAILVLILLLDHPITRERAPAHPEVRSAKVKRGREPKADQEKETTKVRASGRLLLVLALAATGGAVLIALFLRWIADLLQQVVS